MLGRSIKDTTKIDLGGGDFGTPAPLKPCAERPCANAFHRMSIHLVLIQYMLGVTESTSNKHTSQQMFVVTCQMT